MTSISAANAGDSANLRPLLLSIPEARRHLGAIGNTKFYRTVRDYRIQLVRLGGRSLVPMAEVERVVSELTRSPTGAGAVRERAVPLPVGRSKLADARHVTNEKKARRRLALRHAWADEKTTATPS